MDKSKFNALLASVVAGALTIGTAGYATSKTKAKGANRGPNAEKTAAKKDKAGKKCGADKTAQKGDKAADKTAKKEGDKKCGADGKSCGEGQCGAEKTGEGH